jgi:hypothetical protein
MGCYREPIWPGADDRYVLLGASDCRILCLAPLYLERYRLTIEDLVLREAP